MGTSSQNKEEYMQLIKSLRRFVDNISEITKMLTEIREGIANQSDLINRKLSELIDITRNQSNKFSVDNGLQTPPKNHLQREADSFENALSKHPLIFANKTFNTSHPDYDATVVRNFPGKIFNFKSKTTNSIYRALKKMTNEDEIPETNWTITLRDTLAEVKTVPYAEQIFERKAYVENYLNDLENKYQAYYKPGWVNLDDALFLYWVVRQLKPKNIVQTGVCNGLSSAFMMAALAKNGPDGRLYVIDMPPLFDSNDDNWKMKGKVYGVVIPEGKNSGWLVPDAYRDRFEVLSGDAKLLLPGLLERVGQIDMFYHDSDHTYDHMMFEFREAMKYLNKSGVIVSDDISWNASLWDFADEYKAPAYNYRGSMGIACF